jgi:hypothetical protein
MRVPGFREEVDFDGDAAPPRLVHRGTGRNLALTPLEAQLVRLYAHGSDLQQLSELARAQGLAVELSQVAAFFDRLIRAGFIATTAQPPPPLPPPPRPLLPNDPLPMFREDLTIVPSPTSKGLVEVVDPAKNRSFTIYDFEASVARMLDGRRTAEEIIDIASLIGIPVSFASLESFVRQMAAYGFLGAAGQAVGVPGAAARPPRRPWSPDIRELFQSALRLFRSGKPQEALDYLAALLQTDPDNPEALELRQRIQGEPEVDINFDDIHEDQISSAEELEVQEVSDDVEPPKPAAAAADFDLDLSEDELSVLRPSRRPWIFGAVAIVLVAGLFWPVRTRVTVPCLLEPVTVATATAPREGDIASRPVTAGALIKAQQILATYATGDLKKRQAETQQHLDGGQAQADQLRRKAKAAAAAKLEPKLKARKRALDKALATQAKLKAAPPSGSTKKKLAKANRQVAKAQTAFRAVDKKYQALTGQAALAALGEQIARDQAELQTLKDQIAVAVLAPAAGVFMPVAGASASHLTAGEPYGQVVKPDVLRLTASLPAPAASADLGAAVLKLPAGRKGTLRDLAWVVGSSKAKLEATVEDQASQDGSFVNGSLAGATLQLPTGLRPLVWTLLH